VVPILGDIAGFTASLTSVRWTAAVVVASVILWLATRRSRLREAASWTALALAGQACSLQLLWVGSDIRLQLFWGWSDLLHSGQGIFLIAVVLQGMVVLASSIGLLFSNIIEIRRVMTWRKAILLLIACAFCATTIQPEVAQTFVAGTKFGSTALVYLTKVALGLFVFGTGALNLILAVRAMPDDTLERIRHGWARINRKWLPWVCAAWVLVVSSVLCWVVLERMPHVPDEVAYLFQAKYFARGKLYLPPLPEPAAIPAQFQLVDGGKWYASTPPGWPWLLAIGEKAGVPWIVNPLLGAITVLLAHRFLRRLYGRDFADIAVLLLSASPWLLFLSASYMPHALALVCALLVMVAVQETRENRSLFWAAAAGVGTGLLLHVRMLEAVIVVAVAGLWWLAAGWHKLRVSALAVTCAVGMIFVGLFFAYNKAMTGNALQVPINKFTDITFYPGVNRLGFGKDIGNMGWTGLDALPGHGPIDVVMNTNQNAYLLNFETFGWACGSMLFVFILASFGGMRRHFLMWGWILAVWGALSLYWYSGGPDYGARYWYLMIIPLTALTIRGAQAVPEKFAGKVSPSRVWALIALASIIGFINLVPWRSIDKYHNYRGVRSDIRQLAAQYHFGRSLVLVRGPEWPDYDSAFALNPSTFGPEVDGTIYARDLGPQSDAKLRSYYSERPVWVVAGPSETHSGFRVVEGPLYSQEISK
jgi:4-amino-4-deoxy-L-arabinose transferase-like glycosyltransferase